MKQDPTTYTMEPQQGRGAGDAMLGFLQSAQGTPIAIDASNVALLSARQLQVLISARLQWVADDQPFAISAPSEAFLAGLAGFGLADTYFENEVKS